MKALTQTGKVGWDLFRTLRKMRNVEDCITIFGSARLGPDTEEYQVTERLAFHAAEDHYVLTGGGPGIMEAANKGAHAQDATRSVAIGIKLPREEQMNQYITTGHVCKYFHNRKFVMCNKSKAFIIMPGGLGTLDETAEMLTLLVTDKTRKRPVILFNLNSYYKELLAFITRRMVAVGTLSQEEVDEYIFVTDNVYAALRKAKRLDFA